MHTCAILVNLHRSIVHLCHSLHLNMVAVTVVFPLPVDVSGEIFCYVIGKVIGILHLQCERASRLEGRRKAPIWGKKQHGEVGEPFQERILGTNPLGELNLQRSRGPHAALELFCSRRVPHIWGSGQTT